MKQTLFICLAGIFLFSCRNDVPPHTDNLTINVGINHDPQRINPLFRGNAVGREIYPFIFLQLAEFDPKTLEYSPILAKEIPIEEPITSGPHAGGISYTFEILDEAVWTDGQPIQASDFVFTFKAIFHPAVNTPATRNFFSKLTDVIIDPSNPKKFTIIFQETLKIGMQAVGSMEFFPEHIYDPNGALSQISLSDLRDERKLEELQKNPGFNEFALQFNDVRFQVDNCVGSGPYTLEAWETDQFIKVSRKKNWWGSAYPERTFLQAKAETIIFHIIPDETTAVTQLKSGQIDMMSIRNGENFKNLKEESPHLNFHNSQLTEFYYLAMNNKSSKLDDRRVRRAISHLIDVDGFIDQMEHGIAERTIGVILPFKKAYNRQLDPIKLNIDKAAALLQETGWIDSNGNGIRDKRILGQLVELELDMYVGSGQLGQRLAQLLKEKGAPIGVAINIIQKTGRSVMNDHIATGDYDLYAMRLRSALTDYDPYASWHSDNAVLGGSNISQYSNPQADAIIDSLKVILDPNERIKLYKDLQAIMYEDQPVVFLYTPLAKLVSSPRIKPLISSKRPGYFLQTVQVNELAYSDN